MVNFLKYGCKLNFVEIGDFFINPCVTCVFKRHCNINN